MFKTRDDLKALVSLMRELGVARFSFQGLEVAFTPQRPQGVDAAEPSDPIKTEEQRKKEEEEILFHSAG